MNLILIRPEELPAGGLPGRVVLHGRRAEHVCTVHRAAVGDILQVGIIGGAMGEGIVAELEAGAVTLDIDPLETPPPPKLPLTLVLALPRPRVLKRCLSAVAALGVEQLILLGAWRVEKSYWQSPVLAEHEHYLGLGLEQARDTLLPAVMIRKRFKPFAEDELPQFCRGSRALVAHPLSAECPDAADAGALPRDRERPTLLAIGPEGGWLPYEVDKLRAAGAAPIHLGPRIQRVEVALAALIGKLF